MTEPREIAPAAEEVVPGLWTWSIPNSNIGGHVSTSQAVLTREGCLRVDPVRLDRAALSALPLPIATLLTARCHQRAAWRYRKGTEALPPDWNAPAFVDGDWVEGPIGFASPASPIQARTPASASRRAASRSQTARTEQGAIDYLCCGGRFGASVGRLVRRGEQ